MPHVLPQSVEILTTVFTLAGMGYFVAAYIASWSFLSSRRAALKAFSPAVTILKSLKGLDPSMLDAFRRHCRQTYAGAYELLFGVSSRDDPAAAAVLQLQQEFPDHAIRLIECPETLGTNGKVSTLVQLAAQARHDYLLINDSDITVSPRYLERVMAHFAPKNPVPPIQTLKQGKQQTPASRRPGNGTLPWPRRPDTAFATRIPRHRHRLPGRRFAFAHARGRPPLRPRHPPWPSAAPLSTKIGGLERSSIISPTTTSSARASTKPATASPSAPKSSKQPFPHTSGAALSTTSSAGRAPCATPAPGAISA